MTLWAAGGGCGLAPVGGLSGGSASAQLCDTIARAVESLKQGDSGAGMGYINQAVRDAGDTGAAAAAAGAELIRLGRSPEAAQFLQTWVNKRPDAAWDPMLWVTLGQAQRSAGDTKAAEKADAEAKNRAEGVMKEMGRYEPTRSPLTLPKTREAASRFLRVGAYYTSFEGEGAFDFKRGIEAFREALRLLPDDPQVLNALGYNLADKGSTPAEYDEALAKTKRAAELAPDDGMILDSYGWALYKKNDLAGARRVLREAADKVPEAAEIHYHMGVVYVELDMKREAILEFDRALRLHPNYIPAQQEKLRLSGVPPSPL